MVGTNNQMLTNMQGAPNGQQPIVVVQQAPPRLLSDLSDQIRAYKVLGGIQIAVGLLLIVFQVIYDVLSTTTYNGYSGYWFGGMVLGAAAIISVKTRSKGWIICFLTLSVLNCLFGLTLMGINIGAGGGFGETSEYSGLTVAIGIFSAIEGYIIAIVSAVYGCCGLGACMCCHKPPLYKDDSPNYQMAQAGVIQPAVNGQGQHTDIQGQPMVVNGQGQNIQLFQGNTSSPLTQYPPNISHQQGHMVPQAPYIPNMQSQNHQYQGLVPNVPASPREHPFLRERNREGPVLPDYQGYEEIQDGRNYEHPGQRRHPNYTVPNRSPDHRVPNGNPKNRVPNEGPNHTATNGIPNNRDPNYTVPNGSPNYIIPIDDPNYIIPIDDPNYIIPIGDPYYIQPIP